MHNLQVAADFQRKEGEGGFNLARKDGSAEFASVTVVLTDG